ncbi:hypothetical protein AFCA_001695 [Aspergillus flavus]|nr:hypothetical protein AFCA_001695 [Aspergillus flavus]
MTTQKAIVVTSPQQESLVTDRPIPALRDDYILVKTVAVALNPTDWKHIAFLAPPGALIGCDYAGIVEEVGKAVKKPFKKGDRVCGFTHGGNAVQHEDGAFAEYIVAKGDVQIRIPDNLSFQEAATLGVGISTVGQGLYQSLKLALPSEPIKEPEPILIYGGSTATGTLAIQFAKLSGYTVLTTCSPHNFDLVKRLGADAVFDYKDPNSAAEIRQYTNNNLKLFPLRVVIMVFSSLHLSIVRMSLLVLHSPTLLSAKSLNSAIRSSLPVRRTRHLPKNSGLFQRSCWLMARSRSTSRR